MCLNVSACRHMCLLCQLLQNPNFPHFPHFPHFLHLPHFPHFLHFPYFSHSPHIPHFSHSLISLISLSSLIYFISLLSLITFSVVLLMSVLLSSGYDLYLLVINFLKQNKQTRIYEIIALFTQLHHLHARGLKYMSFIVTHDFM